MYEHHQSFNIFVQLELSFLKLKFLSQCYAKIRKGHHNPDTHTHTKPFGVRLVRPTTPTSATEMREIVFLACEIQNWKVRLNCVAFKLSYEPPRLLQLHPEWRGGHRSTRDPSSRDTAASYGGGSAGQAGSDPLQGQAEPRQAAGGTPASRGRKLPAILPAPPALGQLTPGSSGESCRTRGSHLRQQLGAGRL